MLGEKFLFQSDLQETKIKARNSALVRAKDTLIAIMDAMLLTDLQVRLWQGLGSWLKTL